MKNRKSNKVINKIDKQEKIDSSKLATDFALVIDSNIKCDIVGNRILGYQDIINYCNSYGVRYWLIEHCDEKVFNNEGILIRTKFNHFHLVIKFSNTRKRKQTIINDLSKYLDIPKEVISCQYASSIYSCIRYLIHKDNQEKEQYREEDIRTNDRATMSYALTFNCATLTIDDLERAIKISNGNILELMHLIGLQNYQRYRYCINDLINIRNR